MLARTSALLSLLVFAACTAVQPPPDTAQLPPFFYGTLIDNDVGAINEASWALGSPDRTRGDPAEALRAIIAVEYLGGALYAPRWAAISPITKMDMLQARIEMRQVLGISPTARSQLVVNVLTQALTALLYGNTPAAMRVFAGPLFAQPPEKTMQVLNELPTIPAARAATAEAERQLDRAG